MSMEYVQKALDTVVGANLIHQDLSSTVSLADGRPRPVLENAPQVPAKATVHFWDEQSLVGVGTGAASYADGNQPTADALAAVQSSNKTCRIGKTASVTDDMIASYTAGGMRILADGQLEKMVTDAMDYQTELKTREVLDECEWMHISGDNTISAGFPGGQTDGLQKWIGASGNTYTPTGATGAAPVAIAENFVRDVMRNISKTFPSVMPNAMLMAPELITDVNSWSGSGAGNPIVRILQTDKVTDGLVGGNPRVKFYDTGYGVVSVREEPNLSPAFNPLLSGNLYSNVLLYNDKWVKHASLRKLQAETLARIGTSVQRMITTTFCQEHHIGKHAGQIQYVKSAIA